MGAAAKHKHIHEFLGHDGYFRVTGAADATPSSREGVSLGRLLSRKVRACNPQQAPRMQLVSPWGA